jgi:hypothetical protein
MIAVPEQILIGRRTDRATPGKRADIARVRGRLGVAPFKAVTVSTQGWETFSVLLYRLTPFREQLGQKRVERNGFAVGDGGIA